MKNRKGFTLIELLGVIAITGLVVALSTFGISKVIDNSKTKAEEVAITGIEKASTTFSSEEADANWKKVEGKDSVYFCTTIGELISKGFIKEKDALASKYKKAYDKNSFIIVSKNNVTKTIEKASLLYNGETGDEFNICTGSTIYNEKVTHPVVNGGTTYTDEIDKIKFTDAKASSNIESGSRQCFYGTSVNNMDNIDNVEVDENNKNCDISSLNDGTDYYVKVCMKTYDRSYICSAPVSYTTPSIKKPTINVDSSNNSVTITYKSDNIKGSHYNYYKSPIDGTSDKDSISCTNDNNVMTCSGSNTKDITKDTWYRVSSDSVTIKYSEVGTGTVEARTYDKSGNYSENSKKLYQIIYDCNSGTNPPISQIASKGEKIKIRENTCTRSGYNFTKWNDPTGDNGWTNWEGNWNYDNGQYGITNDTLTLKAQWSHKNIVIHFNTNGGNVVETAAGFIKGSGGFVYYKSTNKIYEQIFNYGKSFNNGAGLVNYNNNDYLKITKDGKTAADKQWCTNANGSGTCFDQTTDYGYDDYKKASVEKENNYELNLYVNWRDNILTVKIHANGATKDADGNSVNETFEISKLYYSGTAPYNWPKDYTPPHGAKLVRDGYVGTGKYHVGSATSTTTINQDLIKAETAVTEVAKSLGVLNKLKSGDTTVDLYAGWTIKPVRIYYNSNGGKISGKYTHKGNTDWVGTDSTTYAYQTITGTKDVWDYNWSSGLYITRSGYVAKSGSEWCTKANGSGTCFDQNTKYDYSKYKSISTEYDNYYSFDLYVNWAANTPTITFSPAGTATSTNATKVLRNHYVTITCTASDGISSFDTVDNTDDHGSITVDKTNTKTRQITLYSAGSRWITASCTSKSGGKTSVKKYYYVPVAPTIMMSIDPDVTWCSGRVLTLTCSDNSGSGMNEAYMNDNGYVSTGTSTTSQRLDTPRSGNIATVVTCTDNDGNTNTKSFYYKVVYCSDPDPDENPGGGGSGGGSGGGGAGGSCEPCGCGITRCNMEW